MSDPLWCHKEAYNFQNVARVKPCTAPHFTHSGYSVCCCSSLIDTQQKFIMGQSSSRVQPFAESEQVYDLPHSKPPKSSPNTAGKHHPHRPDEKPVGDGEGIVLPLSPLKEEKKRNKKKVSHFFQWLSSRLRKQITKSKSSGQGEMKDQGTEAETSGRTDGKWPC